MDPRDIIIQPVITEKSLVDAGNKRYTFKVAKDANKNQIKDAVESIFEVKVSNVNTMNRMGKLKRMGKNEGRRASWKKAIVTLTKDSKEIKFFENV